MWLLALTLSHGATPQGTWVLAEPRDVVEARIDAAIDEAASAFGIFKGIARGRLKQVATLCSRYEVDLVSEPTRYRCDEHPPLVTPRDSFGVERVLALERGPTPAMVRWKEPVMIARFAGDSGARANRFSFADDGSMVLDVVVTGDRLAEPLTWTIRYLRSEASVP